MKKKKRKKQERPKFIYINNIHVVMLGVKENCISAACNISKWKGLHISLNQDQKGHPRIV